MDEIIINREGERFLRKIFSIIMISSLLLLFACSDENTGSKELKLPEGIPDFVSEKDFETIDWDKKATNFDGNLIGNEGKSAVIGADAPSLTDQKWMWHLWGVDQVELTVVGYQKETGDVASILVSGQPWTIGTSGPNNGADTHTPSMVKIPAAGEWALLLYTDGKYFDTLIFDIQE